MIRKRKEPAHKKQFLDLPDLLFYKMVERGNDMLIVDLVDSHRLSAFSAKYKNECKRAVFIIFNLV